MKDGEKDEDITQIGTIELERHEINIKSATASFEDYDYQRGLDVCLALLRKDFDNHEAHSLILDTFHALGFQNQLTKNARDELKEIMLKK